jgi:hypothetical protein
MVSFAQLLCSWCVLLPSNQGYLDSNVSREVGRVYYVGEDVFVMSFLYLSM